MGVRERLVGLVLLALLPCVALQVVRIEASLQRAVRRELDGDRTYAQAVGTAFLDYVHDIWTSELAVGSAITLGDRTETPGAVLTLLDGQLLSHPGLRALSWVGPDGVVAVSTRAGAVGQSVAGRGYFRRLLGGAAQVVSGLAAVRPGAARTVTVASAVRRGGRLAGVLLARIDPSELRSVLPPGRPGEVFGLVDRRQTVVYRSDLGGPPAGYILPISPAAPAVGAIRGRITLAASFRSAVDGVVRMGAAVPVRPIGWAAFVSVPVASALAGPRRSASLDLVLLALIALASWLAALAVGRRLLRPVLAMQAAAAAIAAGDLSARVGLTGGDEPASTAAAFDRMADRVERLLGWQASVAALGERGLAGARVHELQDEALAIARRHLGADVALVQELLADRQELVVRAASGWDGALPPPRSAERRSWARYTLAVDEPVVVEDLDSEQRFERSEFLKEHGVVCGVCTVIRGVRGPYGVLGAYSVRRRTITPEEAFFLQTVANLLGAAIERRRVEARLQQANTRLLTVIRASMLPIVAVDNEGCVTVWNPAAERVFGWPEADVLGRPLPTLPEGDDGTARDFRERIASAAAFEGVTRRRRRDGALLDVEASSTCLQDAGRQVGRIAILNDVTERTRFLQVAAHELRNPVAGAKGIVALLRRRLAANRPVADLAATLAVLEHEIDRFSTMLGQMLEAFRAHQGVLTVRREPIDLAAVLRAAVEAFRAAHEEFRFDLEGAEDPVRTYGDAVRLEEVFCNLLDNAVKYSGGARTVRVALEADAACARVSVRDTGIGMAANEIGRVFNPFFRAPSLPAVDPGGLGLGLFVCREVVGRHGGRIWVESEVGRGTTFHVELPVDPDVPGG